VNFLMDLSVIIFAVDEADEELSTIAHVNIGDPLPGAHLVNLLEQASNSIRESSSTTLVLELFN
jgi:hypothetical protein